MIVQSVSLLFFLFDLKESCWRKKNKMNRIGNKWSEDEEQRMVKGLHQGRTLEDMAKDHQRTPKAMEMRRDGMVRRLSTKTSIEDLATLFSLSPSHVRDILATTPPKENTASSSSGIVKAEDILKRLDRMEALLEKMYKRIKGLSSK